MWYLLILWGIMGYWSAGGWLVYLIDLNRERVDSKKYTAFNKCCGIVLCCLITLAGPISLFVFRNTLPTKDVPCGFFRTWFGWFMKSVLRPMKTDLLWPITIVFLKG